MTRSRCSFVAVLIGLSTVYAHASSPEHLKLNKGDHVLLIGNTLAERMQHFGDVPAITHVDDSARVQTVDRETNPRFHRLISEFKALTGCSMLVNTSFNVRDEPIVCTPGDAYRCFMATEMDILVLGNLLLRKEEQ